MTKPSSEPHYVPAVVLREGDVVVGIDPAWGSEAMVVMKVTRLGNGPKYEVVTEKGQVTLGAATKVGIVSK